MRCDIRTIRLVMLAATLGGIFWVSAGDLNPPAGPVESTMLPLNQVEARTPISSLPFTIDQGGSYFLTGSLTGVSGSNGITVTAGDVTLDLNGFSLIGVPGSLDGIHVPGTIFNLTVRNGGVSFWKEDGVDAANALSSVIENVRSFGNLGTGLKIGASSTIRNSGGPNGGDGISTGDGCSITDCTANGSSGNGIVAGPHNRVANCTANFNGLIGIQVGTGSIVSSCTAAENFGDGISMRLSVGCTVTGCTAVNNGGVGIRTGSAGAVVNCTAVDNISDGIRTGDASTVVNSTSQSNGNDGIRAGVSSTILGCAVRINDSLGITVGGGSTITACTANSNVSKGILGFGTTVTSCTANGNGGLGIDCNLAVGNTAFNNDNIDINANSLFNNDCDNCSQP
ncbi:MAG: right-handed parallel beta-helix repeat-containing protein [Planctomycetes bacterium]|nr:right-handed parallel beta-helix repeat-containing protein [Planctomycetota bacterium]